MSRIGKKAVELPSGVTATVSGQSIEVKGPKGGKSKRARQQWGMSRTMVANLVTGVTEGFKKELEIQGVGYRAQMQGNTLKLNLGLSHDVDYTAPEGAWRKPEPYKGKGIRYKGEFVFRKEGKKK